MIGGLAMRTDMEGNKYYDADEARQALGISRSTFDKLVADTKTQKYRRKNDRKLYYRVEDIEALKTRPDEFEPVTDDGGRPALALAY